MTTTNSSFRKSEIDAAGAVLLILFAALMGANQVVVKLTNTGFHPVFAAALRSAGAAVLLLIFMVWRGQGVLVARRAVWAALLIGAVFAGEFSALFLALDYTTVPRASILMYAMPVWLALAAHVLVPGERLTRAKMVGLVLAGSGVATVLFSRGTVTQVAGPEALWGDLLGLVAGLFWAGIALILRITPMQDEPPVRQLLYQLVVSAPLLMGLALWFGEPLLRDVTPLNLAGLGFQISLIAFAGFLLWMWLMARYPASGVASFSFLSPVFAVGFGWLVLGEPVGTPILIGLALVIAGLFFINRPRRGLR